MRVVEISLFYHQEDSVSLMDPQKFIGLVKYDYPESLNKVHF